MNIIIKITDGPKVVDFQCINVDSSINTVSEISSIIEKVFEEFRETFQDN